MLDDQAFNSMIGGLKPEREQRCLRITTPAVAEADQAVDWLEVDAIAIGKAQCRKAADRRIAPRALP
jgi:hypothetical protein